MTLGSADERRITLRLLAYWERKRGVRIMPCEADIAPADIADLWPYCFLVHTADLDKEGYNFTYLGKGIDEIYREGMEKPFQQSSLFPDMKKLADNYEQVISTKKPLVTEGSITIPHGDILKFRQVLLPLGSNTSVQAIFGGMRFLRVMYY